MVDLTILWDNPQRKSVKMNGEKYRALPPWLNQGSSGDAVNHLMRWCITNKVGRWAMLELDSEYGRELKVCIEVLQLALGFEGEDVDGNFGQGTRSALRETITRHPRRYTCHPDDLVMDDDDETRYIDDLGNTKRWNTNAATAEGAVVTIT